MVGKIDRFSHDTVDVARPMLSRTFARVEQHVLHYGVGAVAVLHDLVEIVAQGVRQLGDFTAYPIIERSFLEGLL